MIMVKWLFLLTMFNLKLWLGLISNRYSFLYLTMSTLEIRIRKEIKFHWASKKDPWSYQFLLVKSAIFLWQPLWCKKNHKCHNQELAKQSYLVHQGCSTTILFCWSFVMFNSNGPLEFFCNAKQILKDNRDNKENNDNKL